MRRIIFSITIFLFYLSSVMGQMIPINLPADGNWPTIVGDSIMIIGPRQNELTEEQRYFNPVYLMVYPGKEHLKAQMIRAGACDCDLTKPNRRIGVFSVAPDKKVSFSQGNLQYLPAINLWKFANTQYESLGNANKYLKPTFRNWVDLFGWSANNTTAPFGVSTSTNVADYAGEFVDWGTNTICGDAPGTWRTLSKEEWEYLLNGRENANKLWCRAQVNNVNGLVFLPDQWLCPEGIELKIEQLTTPVFTFDAWSKMENAGAVFLPAAGRIQDKKLVNFNDHGNYWSSTRINDNYVDYLAFTFSSNKLYVDHQLPVSLCRSVRLVHDTIVPETIPDPCLVVKVNDTLSINMMCVEGGTFTMGQGENAHLVSLSSYSIGQTEVTQALWETVMGTNPSANTANKQLPVTNISWYDCQEFINRLNQLTGLRFRLPTEAEWEYAARGGQKSKGYTYAGSNDIKEVAWYNGNSGNTLHAVAQKKSNELGIYDMSGNVWEWCHDWHAPYRTTHQYNPLGPEVGKVVGKRYLRVFRGGSYGYEAAYHQNTFRDITGPEPDKGTANLGLRLVLSDDVNFETIHVNDTLSFHMMDVKGGTFTMGDDNTSNANPAHQVTLSDYYIGQTEVTQTLWKAVMGNVPTGNKNPSYPVGYVSYADCLDFIAKLNKLTSLHFQLPTEAEWEYAAMGGNKSHGYIYSGSNTIDDVAWYDQNSENKLHHVGAKQPNELGIYDMSGNAWEWCADYHGKYTAENQINPQGPATGTDRVIRSGSFRTTADRCTNKHRQAREADYPDSHITLRLVLHDTVPVLPEPEYVDLGLSVKWATFNVGATSPEDYGDYFAWGETEPKETYSWATYKWCDGDYTKLNKYCTKEQYGMVDNQTILQLCDDAAHTKLGDNWRMPTMEECQELVNLCTWTWTTISGINGHVITGPNGNTIFLPATGAITTSGLQNAGESGYYWINSISTTSPYNANDIYNQPSTYGINAFSRYIGRPIRPVYDDRPPKRIGAFSVAADKQVSFSQGNLQYIQSTDTWQFAREQYELIGEDYTTLGIWDLFGWSGKDNNAPFGVSESANVVDYRGEFVDWGKNRIGNDAPATWRTLSRDEWQYLIEIRPKADELYGVAMVAGVQGMILLPDDWVCPEGIIFNHGCHAKDNVENFAKHQTFSQEQWSIMEEAGAIFLPAAGIIYPPSKTITSVAGGAHYYSSDQKDADNAIFFGFRSSYYTINSSANRIRRSVRLVHDTIVPETIPDPCLVVKVNDTLSINMMCVEGGTFMMGQGEDKHQVSLSDYSIAQTEVTQGLWEQVMGYNNSLFKGEYLPVEKVSWEECQTFIQKLNEMTGKHFRLPTEAEWEYAARGGKNSRGYTYAGSNSIDSVAWYQSNSQEQTHTIATLMPNELGIYDMSGNVWEWCQDYYDASTQRVVRGGSFYDVASVCRISSRSGRDANYRSYIGLRLVLDEHEYVDLGLSVMWATFNVGATTPEEYGDYFAWGETQPKDEYSWKKYKWSKGTGNNITITKYNSTDSKHVLEPGDDAAHVHWGGKWRMPTVEEQTELREQCIWTWTSINGIKGHLVTGPNGKSIFLPAAGNITNTDLSYANVMGYQWSSSVKPGICAHRMHFSKNIIEDYDGGSRACGASIRPVYDDRVK